MAFGEGLLAVEDGGAHVVERARQSTHLVVRRHRHAHAFFPLFQTPRGDHQALERPHDLQACDAEDEDGQKGGGSRRSPGSIPFRSIFSSANTEKREKRMSTAPSTVPSGRSMLRTSSRLSSTMRVSDFTAPSRAGKGTVPGWPMVGVGIRGTVTKDGGRR